MQKTVLLVEDDFFIRDLYTRALKMKGVDAQTAVNGEEAVIKYDECAPDVVLLDIMLPNLSGIEVLKHIREQSQITNKTPVIMVTNLNTPESMDEAMRFGANEYWVKADKTPMDVADGITQYITSA